MNHPTAHSRAPVPDSVTLASEAVLAETWDSSVLAEIIRQKSHPGEAPSFLLLGRKEATLLRSHLAAAFGEDAVTTLKGTYYMGLEIVEIDFPEFFHTGGRKPAPRSSGLSRSGNSRLDQDSGSIWRLRLD
jgi:hypothetical protein